MINIVDYFFGLVYYFINDQLNITYSVKLSSSDELNNLKKDIDEKISDINRFYSNLYKPYLPLDKMLKDSKTNEVCLADGSKYYNLNLAKYELIKLTYIKGEKETEFIFTCSHIIMDSVSLIAFVYYLFQGYSLERILSHIDFPGTIKKYRDYLKTRNINKSGFSQLARYIKRKDKGKNKKAYVKLRKEDKNAQSTPNVMEIFVDFAAVETMSEKYKITKGNYLTLKLAEAIFKTFPDNKDGDACLLNITKSLRLEPTNFIDEMLGNYVSRRFMTFERKDFLAFNDGVKCYGNELSDKSYIDNLFHEFYHFQKLNRLPRFMLNWIFKKIFAEPTEGAPSLNIGASFSYFPVNHSILFPPDTLKKLSTNLLEFACYFRVFKRHSPCFFVFPDVNSNFRICMAYNEAFMEQARAAKFINLYKELILEG